MVLVSQPESGRIRLKKKYTCRSFFGIFFGVVSSLSSLGIWGSWGSCSGSCCSCLRWRLRAYYAPNRNRSPSQNFLIRGADPRQRRYPYSSRCRTSARLSRRRFAHAGTRTRTRTRTRIRLQLSSIQRASIRHPPCPSSFALIAGRADRRMISVYAIGPKK